MTKQPWHIEPKPSYPSLAQDLHVDVLVIGGGITGITAAYLLQKHGKKVCLVERDEIGGGESGRTTAHLTILTDERLTDLVKRFGRDHANAAWDAGRAAIEFIHETIHKESIECDFDWVPMYYHVGQGKATEEELQDEAEAIRKAAFDAAFVTGVPVYNDPGVLIDHQAKFHPLKYIYALSKVINREGSYLFEHSEMTECDEKTRTATINGKRVTYDWLVIATHTPLQGMNSTGAATLFQTKIYGYTTYVIRAAIRKGSAPKALFNDSADPYNYLRIDSGDEVDYAVFGGKDVKTGQDAESDDPYTALEELLRKVLPVREVTDRWSGQVIETNDGLPFIGEISDKQYIATGFAGNGYTFGTMAGIMAFHHIVDARNPWRDLFDPQRKKILGGTWDYMKENVDYPYYMLKDRIVKQSKLTAEELQPGVGAVIRMHGKKVAAYKDESGNVTALSPVCTHMGCLVHWNERATCWDCPCHGSRFAPTGEVMAGPAETPLPPIEES